MSSKKDKQQNNSAGDVNGMPKKKTAGAFDGLADMLNTGDLGALIDNNGQDLSMIQISEIAVKKQVREIFEDDENSLQDLANSIRAKGVLQSIIVRPIPGPIPFELVAGERRLRSAKIVGLEQIPAIVRELTDEEAEDYQLAENIQRKNLTQIEIGRRLQRDLDALGSIEAVMEKHEKSRAWISKWLSILDLPEQAQRVVDEKLSADPEVILGVKQIEKYDPDAAKALVDDLKQTQIDKTESRKAAKDDKATKGDKKTEKPNAEGTARSKVQAVKDAVKPPKKPRKDKTPPANPDNVATEKDRSHEEPGPVTVVENGSAAPETIEKANEVLQDDNTAQDDQNAFNSMLDDIVATDEAGAAENEENQSFGNPPAFPPAALDEAYSAIFESGRSPAAALDAMAKEERENCENWLRSFYDVGVSAKDIGRTVIQGLRVGQFAQEGHGAFALSAFLYGADAEAKFSLLNIMGSVKPS